MKLVAFATKTNWRERIDFTQTDNIEDCPAEGILNFKQDELCVFDNEITTKINYENLTKETDVVVNVFSDDGYEQSFRFKKCSRGTLDVS